MQMDGEQPSSIRLGDEITTLQSNEIPKAQEAESSSSRHGDEIPALQSNGSDHNEISEAEPFSSRHGDEITTLHSNESHNEISKAESSSSRHEDEIAILQSKTQNEILEAESSSSRHGIATLHNNENPNEISEAQGKNKLSKRKVDSARVLLVNRLVFGTNNDWKGLEDYITKTVPDDLMASLSRSSKTIFHMIAVSAAPTRLLEKLLSRVPPEWLLQMTDERGYTPLFYATGLGNTKFVEILQRKNKDWLNERNNSNSLPIHEAAKLGHRETVNYLLSVNTLPLDGADGVTLIKYLIGSNLFDIAHNLLKKYPKIASTSCEDTESILKLLAKRPKAFASGSRLAFWKRLLYQWDSTPEVHNSHPQNVDRDPESQTIATPKIMFTKFLVKQMATTIGDLCQKLKIMIWNTLMKLGGPSIQGIRDTKLIHMQTHEIVRVMCAGVGDTISKPAEYEKSLKKPMVAAARWGIYEIVNEIFNTYFLSIDFQNEDGNYILQIAVRHRQEKVFIIMYPQSKKWIGAVANLEVKGNNTLHLAGMLVPSSEVPGAALQMQRELQWFKAVENYCHPSFQDQLNPQNKTPRELFTEEHKGLVEKGEKWMKDTAQSCSVVAALIITVAFAAAFTVPGGSNDSGTPNQLHELSFIIFGISDALALFSSTASVLMFLGILTSRFSEDDFLESLPKKLIIGLITLFFSIASLMVAFAATAYIVLFHPWKWAIIPMGLLGFVLVTLFTTLQFPLLLDMYSSTYGSGFLQQASKNVILNSSDKKFK